MAMGCCVQICFTLYGIHVLLPWECRQANQLVRGGRREEDIQMSISANIEDGFVLGNTQIPSAKRRFAMCITM